jgi:hypothetical protein
MVIGVLLLAIPLLVYWLSFPDSVISQDNQDWGSFGSFLAGVYTFFASFASLATLLFLLYQYFSQKDSQQRLEIINFQKYQAHYQQFLQLIDSIEHDERYKISVINKGELYKLLFPDNNFENCTLQIVLDKEGNDYILNDIHLSMDRLKEMFSSTEVSAQQAFSLVSLLSKVFESLFLKLNRPEKHGDIVFQLDHSARYIILNTEDIDEAVSCLWVVLEVLYHFSGNTAPENISYQVGTSFTLESIKRYKKKIINDTQGYILVK